MTQENTEFSTKIDLKAKELFIKEMVSKGIFRDHTEMWFSLSDSEYSKYYKKAEEFFEKSQKIIDN